MSLEESYRLLTTEAGAVELDRDFIAVTGPQAIEYLQGQLSQDIEALSGSALSLLLEPQGKIAAFVRITSTGPESMVLDFDAGHRDGVLDRLKRFKLRTKADIEVLAGWRCLAVRGPKAVEVLPAPSGDGDGSTVRAAFEWLGAGGVDLLGPAPETPAGMELCDPRAYEVLRIEAGLPALGSELDERTIPEETGLVATTVSFTKGCYTGQELVARIDSRGGNVPRRLRGVVLSGSGDLGAGQVIVLDDREVGVVTSAAVSPSRGPVGLAYIKRGNEPPFTARLGGDGPEVTVVELPMSGGATR